MNKLTTADHDGRIERDRVRGQRLGVSEGSALVLLRVGPTPFGIRLLVVDIHDGYLKSSGRRLAGIPVVMTSSSRGRSRGCTSICPSGSASISNASAAVMSANDV